MEKKPSKNPTDLWRGRLAAGLDETAQQFISSMEEDRRLVEQDITVNQAHVLMLKKQRVVGERDAALIVDSLERARAEHRDGALLPKYRQFVDIHPIIEQYVIDDLGVEIGGKIHIAKSRNDQVMADIRLYLRDEFLRIMDGLLGLIGTLVTLAGRHRETIMPGYTHTQHAQVTSLAHYLLSYADILTKDYERVQQYYSRLNLSPLGACAFAGTSVPIDRRYTARLLGFAGVVENSIEAISGRDVLQEAACTLAILMDNMSRMASDIILWSTFEFGMVELSDELSDTSSAMPQKKNPDPLEAIRGKAMESISVCSDLLGLTRGLVSGYHKDFQEMKRPLWKVLDDVRFSIAIMTKAFGTLTVKKARMRDLVVRNNVAAMDLAECIARETPLSFRQAHFLVGSLVKWAVGHKTVLANVTSGRISALAREVLGKKVTISPASLKKVVDPLRSLRNRISLGGPSPQESRRIIADRLRIIEGFKRGLARKGKDVESSARRFRALVKGARKESPAS